MKKLGQLTPTTLKQPSDNTMQTRLTSSSSSSSLVTQQQSSPGLNDWLGIFKEWNAKTKVSALEQILEMCEHAHIKHVHNYIEPKLQRDYISELPRELLLHLLTYVRPRDLYKLAQVSPYWHQIANDPILWKNICKRASIKIDQRVALAASTLELNCCEYHKSISTTTTTTTTRNPYMFSPGEDEEEEEIESDLEEMPGEPTTSKKRKQSSSSSSSASNNTTKSRTQKSSKTKKMNDLLSPNSSSSSSSSSSPVISILPAKPTPYCFLNSFNPYKRAYLIDFNVTRNWCTRPLPRPIMLKAHDDHVITCLKFDGRRVVSGSDDNTLKVWCAATGKLLQTLVGHTGGVWASQLKDNIVISGSTDRTVRVWNIDTGACVHVLTGHTSTVRCLALNDAVVDRLG